MTSHQGGAGEGTFRDDPNSSGASYQHNNSFSTSSDTTGKDVCSVGAEAERVSSVLQAADATGSFAGEQADSFGLRRPGCAHIDRSKDAAAPSPVLAETTGTLVPSTQTTGVSCRDFKAEAESDGRETCPAGSRFRRQSLQVATKVLQTHTKHPAVRFADSPVLTGGSPSHETNAGSLNLDGRSASPCPIDENQNEKAENEADGEWCVPEAEPQTGVLGIILDLYKFQAQNLLGAAQPEESMPVQRGRSSGCREATATHQSGFKDPARSTSATSSLQPADSSLDHGANSPQAIKMQRRGPLDGRLGWPHDGETVTRVKGAIRAHIMRQLYILKLCRALMTYGAPTHRLESYMATTARSLCLHAHFMYLPNCMFVSFTDDTTQTTKVSIVTAPCGIDLGRMRDAHEVYLHVVYKMIQLEEGMDRLETIMAKGPKFQRWLRVLMYGFACSCVAMFGFGGSFADLPLAFVLGIILGVLHLVVAPGHHLFSNVLEVVASVLISFLARAFGSLSGGSLFCFSALAQSGIALILPGYMVLCAALELQTQHLVAGGCRLAYAMFYTLLLGYGITIGSTLYGYMNKNASSAISCAEPVAKEWSLLFVPIFTVCIAIINQAKWKQLPIMMFISISGFVVNWRASLAFRGASTISNTLGALSVGVLANLYSRLGRHPSRTVDLWNKWIVKNLLHKQAPDVEQSRPGLQPGLSRRRSVRYVPQRIERRVGYGLASAAMLPAIFVQVPSGIAVGGSLLAGVTSADWIVSDEVGETAIEDISAAAGVAFNVMIAVIQVAISIAVGLALSALIVYPLESRKKKKLRTGVSSL